MTVSGGRFSSILILGGFLGDCRSVFPVCAGFFCVWALRDGKSVSSPDTIFREMFCPPDTFALRALVSGL